MTWKKRQRKIRNQEVRNARAGGAIELSPGDILHLHKDILMTPSGRYEFRAQYGDLVSVHCGDAMFGFHRKFLRFCSVEQGSLSEDEIEETKSRAMKLLEEQGVDDYEEVSGFTISVSEVSEGCLKELELDA